MKSPIPLNTEKRKCDTMCKKTDAEKQKIEEERRKQAEEDERAWKVMRRNDLYKEAGLNPFLLPWDYLKY